MEDVLHIIHCEFDSNEKEKAATRIRKQNYLDQCAAQGIKFVVSPGVKGLPVVFHNINKAHKNLVQMAKDKGYKRIIIAEDDIVFTAPGSWDYFLSQIPEDYDLFCGVIYAGTVQDGKILSAFSGGMTLYVVNSRFFDAFINIPNDQHVDRFLGTMSDKYEMLVPEKYVCKQLGGYSFNLGRPMTYGVYEERCFFYEG